MANWYGAGTSFLDKRTTRYKTIAQVSALVGGYVLPHTKERGLSLKVRRRKGRGYGGRSQVGRRRKASYYYRQTSRAGGMPRGIYSRYRKGRVKQYDPRHGGYYINRRRPYRNRRTGGYMHMRGHEMPAELKYNDYDLAAEPFTTSWAAKNPTTVNCVSAVAQGDSATNRDGRIYYIHSIFCRGEIRITALESQIAPFATNVIRVILVEDTQTNGAEISGADVMTGAGAVEDHLGFRNLQHSGRFKVLWDRTFVITIPQTNEGAANLFAHGTQIRKFTFFKKFKKPIKVHTDGTSAIVGDITDHTLQVVGVANSTSPTLTYHMRMRFKG